MMCYRPNVVVRLAIVPGPRRGTCWCGGGCRVPHRAVSRCHGNDGRRARDAERGNGVPPPLLPRHPDPTCARLVSLFGPNKLS